MEQCRNHKIWVLAVGCLRDKRRDLKQVIDAWLLGGTLATLMKVPSCGSGRSPECAFRKENVVCADSQSKEYGRC